MQRIFEVGKALFGRRIRAEALAAPFGDWMQRRVLQELRGAPLDPGVRRLCEPRVELLDQSRFAEPRFAHDQHELTFAGPSAFPAARQQDQFLITTDKGRLGAHAAPSSAAARANDAKKLNRFSNPFEFVRALLLGDKEPGDLALDGRGDQDCSRLGSSLHACGDIWRFTKNFAGRVNDNQAALEAYTRRQCRRTLGCVSRIEVPERPLDGERGPYRALCIVLQGLWITEESHQPVAELLQHVAAQAGHRR